MSMLSSVANRLFWMARYLERTEGTARIINSYSQLILDVPKDAGLGWETLINTIDAQADFSNRYKNATERNVLKFMIADKDSTSSLRFAVKAARENVRTTRDVMPRDVWELMNEMYLFVEERAEQSIVRRNRFEFLEQLIAQCQQMQGHIYTTLTRDHSFTFLKIGSLLERADMTTRVVDVATGAIIDNQDTAANFEPFLWTNLLLSLSAGSAYRREVGPLVEAESAVDFVFKNGSFPRSVHYCIRELQNAFNKVSSSGPVEQLTKHLGRMLEDFSATRLNNVQLHQFIDQFQQKLFLLNKVIDEAWFVPKK